MALTDLEIVPVPCLRDNYAYLVRAGGQVAVVDPSESAPVLQALADRQWEPDMIWTTHHHWDHVGGNVDLKARFPRLQIMGYAGDAERIPALTHPLSADARFLLGQGDEALEVTILFHPGHTLGAISYCVAGRVFTGDTLFGAGCGRVFEGTYAQMHHGLNQVLGSLPEDTLFYFGHEYTAANLRFAQAVEPQNAHIQQRQQALKEHPLSVPSTLARERLTNPFLRCHVPEVRAAAERQAGHSLSSGADVFATLRQWKDQF